MAKRWAMKRDCTVLLRLTVREKDLLSKRAEETGLAIVEYARRKIFDMPLQVPKFTKRKITEPMNATHSA